MDHQTRFTPPEVMQSPPSTEPTDRELVIRKIRTFLQNKKTRETKRSANLAGQLPAPFLAAARKASIERRSSSWPPSRRAQPGIRKEPPHFLSMFSNRYVDPDALEPITIISRGRTLIVARDRAAARQCADRLSHRLDCFVLIVDEEMRVPYRQIGYEKLPVACSSVKIKGHFGDFSGSAGGVDGLAIGLDKVFADGHGTFDLVLDLTPEGAFHRNRSPHGYYHVGEDQVQLEQALIEMPEMTGRFKKPQFIAPLADRCVHRHGRFEGCRRCLQACPHGAIHNGGRIPRIDAHACQGCAVCATACPSGALRFHYLPIEDLLTALRLKLDSRPDQDRPPMVIFHQAPIDAPLPGWLQGKPEVVGLGVQEIGRIGIETLLTSLAYGAARVAILLDSDIPLQVRNTLQAQVYWSRSILSALGAAQDAVALIERDGRRNDIPDLPDAALGKVPPASFSPFCDKRTLIRLSVEHLARHHVPIASDRAALPADAPFGGIRIDSGRCTACLDCVGACGVKALTVAAGSPPGLRFIEANCVQCGLCVQSCPRQAIQMIPRVTFDRRLIEGARILLEPGTRLPTIQ